MAFKTGTLIFECDKALGPAFESELEARGGLFGQHFSWYRPNDPASEPFSIEFFDDTPQAVIDDVLAVYEAHDPTKPADTEQP